MCVCVRPCARVCVCACVRVRVRVRFLLPIPKPSVLLCTSANRLTGTKVVYGRPDPMQSFVHRAEGLG